MLLGVVAAIQLLMQSMPPPYRIWGDSTNAPAIFILTIILFFASIFYKIIINLVKNKNSKRKRQSSIKNYIEEKHGEHAPLKHNKIAIIDDQPENYDINHINNIGFHVTSIKEISLSNIDSLSKYDVLILDISNVVIEDRVNGGLKLMTRARKAYPKKAIIAASSKKYDPSLTQFFKKANAVIDTPIRATDLEEAILDVIDECYSKNKLSIELDSLFNESSLTIEQHQKILNLSIDFIENNISNDDFNKNLNKIHHNLDNKKIREILERIKNLP